MNGLPSTTSIASFRQAVKSRVEKNGRATRLSGKARPATNEELLQRQGLAGSTLLSVVLLHHRGFLVLRRIEEPLNFLFDDLTGGHLLGVERG